MSDRMDAVLASIDQTQPSEQPCGCHDEVKAKLDRILQLLEGRARGGTVKHCKNTEPHLHGTGCVIQATNSPDSGIQVHIDPQHVIGATIHELRRQGRLRG